MFCGNAFDRCWRMSNVFCLLFYILFFMISGSWKGQTDAYYVFYIGFIYVSRKHMREFVEGFQCLNLVYFIVFFCDLKLCWFYISFVDVLWKCIWPLLADVNFSFLVCFPLFLLWCRGLGRPNGSIFCIWLLVLYMFRDHWCESLWRVASDRILCVLLYVFDDFGERHSSCILY